MMISVSILLYLFARALPRIDDTNTTPVKELKLPHWIMGYIERCDEAALSFFEKTLRRLRVLLLKIDNAVSDKLKKFKREAPKENVFLNSASGESTSSSSNSADSQKEEDRVK